MSGSVRRTLYHEYGTGLAFLITAGLLLIGSPLTAQQSNGTGTDRHILDRIKFGSTDSERRHQFDGQNTEVFAGQDDQETISGVHITSTTASSGNAPENTLREQGEWHGSKGEWIQYRLSQPATLERITITWEAPGNNYLFEILTSQDGTNWKKVTRERSSGRTETYEFEPVRPRFIRIRAWGADRWWRPAVFRLKQIRIGDLPYPDAYQKPLTYQPAPEHRCRRLGTVDAEQTGKMQFTLQTDPDRRNYVTVKFWGSDWKAVPLRLADGDGHYIDGAAPEWKPAIGYGTDGMGRFWSFGGSRANGAFPGRFIYATYPLPASRTRGADSFRMQLEAPEGAESQGIYAAYTHIRPFFVPPSDEQQGKARTWGPNRPDQWSPEKRERVLIDRARELINQVMENRPTPTNQKGARRLKSLSEAYHAEWSEHHEDPEIVDIVKNAIDHAVGNEVIKGWHYNGLLARCFTELSDAFKKEELLSKKIDHDGDPDTAPVARRAAYAQFFKNAFDWRKSEAGGRREVSNQAMATSFSLFRLQRALQELNSKFALSEKKANRYLQESLGMKPFYSPYPRRDWVRAAADRGFPFYIISSEGLAKEGGHASHYGELAVKRAGIYAEELGTAAAKKRAAELIRARAIMSRRPSNDGAGYAALRAENTFTFRGRGYPGGILYMGDGSQFVNAAILEDPVSLRLAELYMKHGHFDDAARQGRVVRRVGDYLKVREMLKNRDPEPLPLEPQHEDFGWGDEDVGVFAIKHGDRLIHGSFVLTIPGAVVPYARVHYTTSRIDRLADVPTRISVPDMGEHLSMADGKGFPDPLTFPKTPPPPGLDLVGQWRKQDIRASMAYFYQLRFGDYLVGMNTTKKGSYRENTFQLNLSEGINADRARDLVSGKPVNLNRPVRVEPATTIILYLGE